MSLRYVNCELPSGLEKSIVEFEDFFDLLIKPYFDQLDALNAQYFDSMVSELDKNILLRDQLLNGAPVAEMGSLSALEASTGLTDPSRDTEDSTTKRWDEIKLGAAGIVLINGKFFVMLQGTRVQSLRYLWECSGGNYQAFVAMGNAVIAGKTGTHMMFEYNPITKRFPFQGKPFDNLLELSGYHKSLFMNRAFWNAEISPSYSSRAKLESYGMDDDQIINTLNQKNPNDTYEFSTQMSLVASYLKSYTKLTFLSANDQLRTPKWKNEVAAMSGAINSYLEWRFRRRMTSSVVDPDFWISLINTLTQDDIVELMEHRPDVLDMDVAPTFATIQGLMEKAMTLGTGTTVINTYLQNMPKVEVSTVEITAQTELANAAITLWKQVKKDDTNLANNLEVLIQYLTGSLIPLTDNTATTNQALSGKDIKTIFPPTVRISEAQLKTFTDDIGGDLLNTGIAATNAVNAQQLAEQNKENKDNVAAGDAYGSGGTNVQGLPTQESFSMLMARRVKWDHIGASCFGTDKIQRADSSSDNGVSVKTVDAESGVETVESSSDGSFGASSKGNTKTTADKIYKYDPVPTDSGSVRKNPDIVSPLAAKDRNKVERVDNGPVNTFNGNFQLTCSLGIFDEFGRRLAALMDKLDKWLIPIIETLKEIIIHIQDKIDSFILAIQKVIDSIIGKLEKLLTIDINFAGGLGFDSSLLKCSWNLDFGMKIDLLSLLLALLSQFFPLIGLPLQKFLNLLNDFLNKIFCIPINFINSCLGNPTLNKILGALGCTIKDIPLPDAILELLQLLSGLFNLRSLVLKQASGDWMDMAFNCGKQKAKYAHLSMFASACTAPPMTHVIDNMVDRAGEASGGAYGGADIKRAAVGAMIA